MIETFIYLKNFITDKYVASITPTFRSAVEKVCGKIDFNDRRLIVEYGPGTGAFTVNLLNNMTGNSRLIAIERNPNFCRILEKGPLDPRLKIFNDCAGNVLDILKACEEAEADYIISGIPFSLLSLETKLRILNTAYSALKEGGKFLAYQNFFQLPEFLKNHLENVFQNVRAQYVFQSFPPLVVFEALKSNGNSGTCRLPEGTAL
ncbi:MAG: methyltransferase [Proteobacteria bacterium]|nr:methyltransferase [Pseudomonadota bacterium]